MKVSQFMFVSFVSCAVTSAAFSNELLNDSWQELMTFAATERTQPLPEISTSPEVEKRIAEYIDGKPIRISAAFLKALENEEKFNYQEKKGLLLFLLGHEVGHRLMAKDVQNPEMQADFFGALLVTSIRGDLDSSVNRFFKFAEPWMGVSNPHGSTAGRQQKILANEARVKALSRELREIMQLIDSEEDGAVKSAGFRLAKANKEISDAGLGGVTAFGVQLIMLRHRIWLQSAKRSDIMVQLSLTLPSEKSKSRGSKGAMELPGDSSLFSDAMGLYDNYQALLPANLSLKINYLALLAYHPSYRDSALAGLPEFEKSQGLSAHDWNNMGVTAFILANAKQWEFSKALEYFDRAKNANMTVGQKDLYLEAKILYNLARTYERLGKTTEAKRYLQNYSNHAGAHRCWRTENLQCPEVLEAYKKISELGGFTLGDSYATVNARRTKFLNTCKTGGLEPSASGNELMEVSCGNGQSTWLFKFANKKLFYIQVSGKSDQNGVLKFSEADGKDQLTFSLGAQAPLTQLTAQPDINSEIRKRYPKLGLTLTIDSAQTLKIKSLAIGKDS